MAAMLSARQVAEPVVVAEVRPEMVPKVDMEAEPWKEEADDAVVLGQTQAVGQQDIVHYVVVLGMPGCGLRPGRVLLV